MLNNLVIRFHQQNYRHHKNVMQSFITQILYDLYSTRCHKARRCEHSSIWRFRTSCCGIHSSILDSTAWYKILWIFTVLLEVTWKPLRNSSTTWWPCRLPHTTVHSWGCGGFNLRSKSSSWLRFHLVLPGCRHHVLRNHALVCVDHITVAWLTVSCCCRATVTHDSTTRVHVTHCTWHLSPQHGHGWHVCDRSLLWNHTTLHHGLHTTI